MFERSENVRFWNFCKFLLIFIIPLILSSIILANFCVFLSSVSIILTFIIGIVTLTVFCFFYIKYIHKMIDNEKVINWIEKPWNGPTIIFKK